MRRKLTISGACCLLLVAGAVAAIGHGSRGRSRMAGTAMLPGEQVRFALILRVRHAGHLQSTLAGIESPGSRTYREVIRPVAFGRRFGISSAQLSVLEHRIRASGLRVLASYPQRTELTVTGTVRTVSHLLHVGLLNYVDVEGDRFHAPTAAPVVPAAFGGSVVAVTGLDTRPQFRAADVPGGALTPPVARTAYDVAPLHQAGFLGQGQQIAVVSFSAFNPSDPAAFARRNDLTGPAPTVIKVDGGTTDMSGQDEANLDIDVIRSIAPDAQILVYEVPQSSSAYADAINRIISDDYVGIISSSWGECELGLDSGERAADSRALAAAVADGISMFISSGDNGAFDCQSDDVSDHRLSVDWPAASPDAIAVGGTRLYVDSQDHYVGEAGWDDPLSAAGGGGGYAAAGARPSWQAGPGVVNSHSNGNRQVPDVSADADPGTGWSFYSQGQPAEAGGTSAAAPFWAASMLLIQQYLSAHSKEQLGFVDPMLYALAASKQAFPPFHDVTQGTNRYYRAGPGWDAATGLGSPDVFNLARDIAAYLHLHPNPN